MAELEPEEIRAQRESIIEEINQMHEQLADLYGQLDILQSKCEHPNRTTLLMMGALVNICPDCSHQEQDD